MGHALSAFVDLMDHGSISWDTVDKPFLESVSCILNPTIP